MTNKKKVAAIIAVNVYFQSIPESKEIKWTGSRPGWHNQLRGNWMKK